MKNIVICSDGTGNEYGENNTNVVETYTICKKSAKQIAFYDPGIGTGGWEYDEKQEIPLRSLRDQATGKGLQNNVNDAYRFLMQQYTSGDRIFLFGFSRGAFTVRSLAGMLYKVGLLPPENHNLIPYAANLYNVEGNTEIAHGFRKTFSRICPVHFIGVWDTVASLVMNAGTRWHSSALNPEVKYGYHAIAIDEHRVDFEPCLWLDDAENLTEGQVIEQVWFPGHHSDVGGWHNERGLANISLHWMLGHAKSAGLSIDESALAARVPDPHDEIHPSRKGIWLARGTHHRKIPLGAKVHASAFARRRRPSNKYKPRSLLTPSNYTVIE